MAKKKRGKKKGGLGNISLAGLGQLGVINELTTITEGGHKFICYTKPSDKPGAKPRAYCARVNKIGGPTTRAAAAQVKSAARASRLPGGGNPKVTAKGKKSILGVKIPKGMNRDAAQAYARSCTREVQAAGGNIMAKTGEAKLKACLVRAFKR